MNSLKRGLATNIFPFYFLIWILYIFRHSNEFTEERVYGFSYIFFLLWFSHFLFLNESSGEMVYDSYFYILFRDLDLHISLSPSYQWVFWRDGIRFLFFHFIFWFGFSYFTLSFPSVVAFPLLRRLVATIRHSNSLLFSYHPKCIATLNCLLRSLSHSIFYIAPSFFPLLFLFLTHRFNFSLICCIRPLFLFTLPCPVLHRNTFYDVFGI